MWKPAFIYFAAWLFFSSSYPRAFYHSGIPALFAAAHPTSDHSFEYELERRTPHLPRKFKMPYTIVAFETRKPQLTPKEFEDYYDNVHAPLIKKLMGKSFPDTHARYFLKRKSDVPNTPDSLVPLVLMGTAADFDYDAIVVMTFEDEAQFLDFQTKFATPEIGGQLAASAEKFIIQSALRVVAVQNPHILKG